MSAPQARSHEFRRDFRVREPHGFTVHTQPRPVVEAVSPLLHSRAVQSQQDLVVQLCRMPVDLAAPLLRASLPSLDTPALLALIAATGEAHHTLVARRGDLDWRVIKALLRTNSDEVLLTLAENHALSFDADDQVALARLAEDRVMLRAAILKNPCLSQARAHIKLNAEDGLSHNNLKLVRYLRAGQPAKFLVEAARRLDCEATLLQRVVSGVSVAPLALVACALGLDRAVFVSLLPYWQKHEGEADCNAAHKPLVLSIFGLSAAEAKQKLTAIAATR